MLTFQIFTAPCRVLAMCSAPEDRPPLVPPTNCLLSPTLPPTTTLLLPTTTCLGPTTTCYLPTTTCCLPRYLLGPRLPVTSHDYLLLPTTPALPRHLLPTKKWWYNSNGCKKR